MWIVCLVDDYHKMSSLIFSEKKKQEYLKVSSAAIVRGALRINQYRIFIDSFRNFILKITRSWRPGTLQKLIINITLLTFTTIRAYSADDKLMLFFLIFTRKQD